MENVTLEKITKVVEQTWTEGMGKKITKHHFRKAMQKKASSLLGNIDELYQYLKPYIQRTKKISELKLEEILKQDKTSLWDKKRADLKKRIDTNFEKYGNGIFPAEQIQ
jgi:uncharacterized UPF0160 family protein